MPLIDSTNCTISAALASRVRRYAENDRLRNHRDSSHSGRKVASATSASGRSSTSRMTPIETTDSSAVISPSSPSSSSSLQRVHVGGQPGDHPAGGVALVEGQRQPLHVVEDPPAQVEQHGLADPPGPDQEQRRAARRPRRRRTAARRRPPAAASSRRRPAPGCPGRCRRRPATGRPSPPRSAPAPATSTSHSARRCGRSSEPEQPAAAGPQQDADPLRQLVDVLGGDPAPVRSRTVPDGG